MAHNVVRLTDYTGFADAQRFFSKAALWDLFDGDPDHLNIAHECVDRHARDRLAIRIASADGTIDRVTFGQLADLSSRFAHWLHRRGIRKGERVAIMLDPSPAFYAALFGTMKAGAVAVPLFTAFGPDSLRARLDDCAPALLLLTPDKPELAGTGGIATVTADDRFTAELDLEPRDWTPATASHDMAMYQYTSGTSRQLPEAVRHRHRAVVTVIIAALYATGVRPGDRFMCPSSPAWGHGLWHGTIAPLALGVEITSYAGKFDPERLLHVISGLQITNLSAAATHYRMMRNSNKAGNHVYALEKLSFTGEPLDSETARWARDAFGQDVCSIYGTTEVGVILGAYPGALDLPARIGSLGKPLPGCEVAIRDGNGNFCAPGEIGEIMLRRRDGWFPVKDLGSIDEDGYFYHHGRADDVIISSGWTISAVEVEDTVLKHNDVTETAVIGIPDPERGQIIKAFIVSSREGDAAFTGELQELVRQRLGRHEYPRQVAFVTELPKTPAGKVNRKILRDQEAARREAGQ